MDFILPILIILCSLVMFGQGLLTLYWMIFAWSDVKKIEKNKAPEVFFPPINSITALIPAKNETRVIEDTINAVNAIDYPEHLKKIKIICHNSDLSTIFEVKNVIKKLKNPSIELLTFNGLKVNKPKGLNEALRHVDTDVVVIFDAEDQPHRDIYNVVNTVFIQKKADVVQAGVQLMNLDSKWFSMLNVLEYFFWFKSALHYFAMKGIVPLGGNTVFFKSRALRRVGGWDEQCLTEDADIGIRISLSGARTAVVYDERYSTQEETPESVWGFIQQRTRWNQGFIQIFLKGDFLLLPGWDKKLLAGYILIMPMLQVLFFIYLPISLIISFNFHFDILVTLLSIVPLYIFILQIVILNIGLYVFTKDYGKKYKLYYPLKLILSIYAYFFILLVSSVRSVLREAFKVNTWEKTKHVNAHRLVEAAI